MTVQLYIMSVRYEKKNSGDPNSHGWNAPAMPLEKCIEMLNHIREQAVIILEVDLRITDTVSFTVNKS